MVDCRRLNVKINNKNPKELKSEIRNVIKIISHFNDSFIESLDEKIGVYKTNPLILKTTNYKHAVLFWDVFVITVYNIGYMAPVLSFVPSGLLRTPTGTFFRLPPNLID